MANLLELKGVHKRYPGFHLKEISFTLPKGYIMGLVGPNGAGKTTTIQLILNMIKRDSGQIRVFGLDNIDGERLFKRDVGVVFDSLMFPTEWKLKDLESALKPFYVNWDTRKFSRLAEEFGLPKNKKFKDFSRGMQMKTMLAAALAHNAKLLILDEPTSGLDVVTRDQLSEILQTHIQDGEKSVLFSTHITSDLERIADYVTLINDGQIFFSGSLDELKASFKLIKGKKEELTDQLRHRAVGLRCTNLGFEALIGSEDLDGLAVSVAEEATLDEIVIFASKKEGER